MNYKKLDGNDMSSNGTSLQGYVRTTRNNIVNKLGDETYWDNDYTEKVQSEWVLKFDDGKVATIYNYKTGITPLDEYDWHIGGHDEDVVKRVEGILND